MSRAISYSSSSSRPPRRPLGTLRVSYSTIPVTTPAPTVRPPSRMANRSPPPRRQRDVPRHVRRPKVELRPVPREERRVPPPLFLRQHVHLRPELQMRVDRPRLRQN